MHIAYERILLSGGPLAQFSFSFVFSCLLFMFVDSCLIFFWLLSLAKFSKILEWLFDCHFWNFKLVWQGHHGCNVGEKLNITIETNKEYKYTYFLLMVSPPSKIRLSSFIIYFFLCCLAYGQRHGPRNAIKKPRP